MRLPRCTAVVGIVGLLLTSCQAEVAAPISHDAVPLTFSGERALETERDFVLQFPNRHSGQPNNHLAAEWLRQRFTQIGLRCAIDEWQVINYSRPFVFNNVVCKLSGATEQEILVMAHLDQAPTTVQGADNDGSGIAILLQLAELFAADSNRPYTLTFLATDAEEYGMLGSARYIETHAQRGKILAAISLDNLGHEYYDGLKVELTGQFAGYGPIWLALTAREAARAAGAKWDVRLRATFDQVTDQAAPVSFMDQGPEVAAGIPAIGLAGDVPPQSSALQFDLYHTPGDSLEHQTAESLGQSGLIADALIRQLLSMKSFPHESGPYLYFDGTGQVLRGVPLSLAFAGLVAIFLVASVLVARRSAKDMMRGWRDAAPHFLGLWFPLLGGIVLLYLLVAVGLMDVYARYPATIKDVHLLQPRWPAVVVFISGTTLLILWGRSLVRRVSRQLPAPRSQDVKSLSLLIIGLCGLYILAINPFSLLFMVPLLFWLLIRERAGRGRWLNVLFFALGGLVVYGLIYIFGFTVLHMNLAFLWYVMNMFSTRMIGFPIAAIVTAIIAAGLATVVSVPRAHQGG